MELKRPLISSKATTGTLLIVPYGIETTEEENAIADALAFNRTLWN